MRISLFLAMLLILAPPLSASAADTEGPEVGAIEPLEAVWNVPQLFYVTADDPSEVDSCSIMVSSNADNMEPMTYSEDNDRWEGYWTFSDDRTANSIRAVCEDTLGNSTTGPARVMTVSDVPLDSTDGESDAEGDGEADVDATEWDSEELIATSPVLIKTVCPGDEDYTHTCRTVYFLDDEGYRHAFPNERVYFTWYEDYTNLHLITDEMMASFSLGANVTYHPGTRMVKYQTVDTVYVVERYSVLRPITSEEVAIDLYGENWNHNIDDISEAFYANYSYGEDIESADDFDVDAQMDSVDSINDNL